MPLSLERIVGSCISIVFVPLIATRAWASFMLVLLSKAQLASATIYTPSRPRILSIFATSLLSTLVAISLALSSTAPDSTPSANKAHSRQSSYRPQSNFFVWALSSWYLCALNSKYIINRFADWPCALNQSTFFISLEILMELVRNISSTKYFRS